MFIVFVPCFNHSKLLLNLMLTSNKIKFCGLFVSYRCFHIDYETFCAAYIFGTHYSFNNEKSSKMFIYITDVELPSENLWQFSESAAATGHCLSHKKLHLNAFTSSQGLAVHRGHSLSSHRSVVDGLFLASQLISLSLHSTARFLIPEPQVTEHC